MTDTRAATDTRHRVPYPNAKPRLIKLVGLGEGGQQIARAVGAERLAHVAVVELPGRPGSESTPDAMVGTLAANADELARALEGADMIFVVVVPGDDVAFANAIARIARDRGTPVTGVIVENEGGGASADGRHSADLRRACDMLVIVTDGDYLTGMLAALGT